MQSTSTCSHEVNDFGTFNTAVQQHFAHMTAGNEHKILTVSTEGLFDVYLSGFPDSERQGHNCHCCRRFIEQFGGLVLVTDGGRPQSVIWPTEGVSELFAGSSSALAATVAKRAVSDVFMTRSKALGIASAGGWSHFSIDTPKAMIRAMSEDQLYAAVALKRQDIGTLQHGLLDFTASTINTALGLLRSESLYRSEKVLGPCEWLSVIRAQYDAHKGDMRRNLLWRAVADAPVGFATPRSSMIGTLLEDIASGMAFDDVKHRFASKMDPTKYQRPQAPATAGNIAAAEKTIAAMGLEPALHRRFARLDEIQTIWTPTEKAKAQAEGVFGHLVAKGVVKPASIAADGGLITWEKFCRMVLPTAESIEFKIMSSMNWCALLTAVNADAPPILQWDREEARNPVSWYVYNSGSQSSQWGVQSNAYAKVTAVALQPSMWNGGNTHQGKSALFVIDGAADSNNPSLGLFPEILRSELHPIRATIEAYSRAGTLEGRENASACGIRIGDGQGQSNRVRVTSSTGIAEYTIDRWD